MSFDVQGDDLMSLDHRSVAEEEDRWEIRDDRDRVQSFELLYASFQWPPRISHESTDQVRW